MEQQISIELTSLYLWKPLITLNVGTQHCNSFKWHTGDQCGQSVTKSTNSPENSYLLPQLRKGHFIHNFFQYFLLITLLLVNVMLLTEKETATTEDWWLFATEQLHGHQRCKLSQKLLSPFPLSSSPAGLWPSPDLEGWEGSWLFLGLLFFSSYGKNIRKAAN